MSQWSEDEKLEAIKTYLIAGSYRKAAEATGIPEGTIAWWKHSAPEWWAEAVQRASQELSTGFKAGWHRIQLLALNAIMERLEHGDEKVVSGKTYMVPVPAKDLAIIAQIAADKLSAVYGVKRPPLPDAQANAEARREELRRIAVEEQSRSGGQSDEQETAHATVPSRDN